MAKTKLTHEEIGKRLGRSPEEWTFKGQCFDVGRGNHKVCMLTQANIQYVFTLKTKDNTAKAQIGVGAFAFLKRWNPDLWTKLEVSRQWLMLQVEGERRDKQAVSVRRTKKAAEKTFKILYKEAQGLLRKYRSITKKEWLPEALFNLDVIVERERPAFKTEQLEADWYQEQIDQLVEYLDAGKACIPAEEEPVAAVAPVSEMAHAIQHHVEFEELPL
jgi:hypothetical protein